MGAGTFTLEQLGELTAEFRAKFGKDHVVAMVHDPEDGYRIQYTADNNSKITTINAVEPAIAEAIFKYGKSIAAHNYAMAYSQIPFMEQEQVRSEFGAIVGKAHADVCDMIMNFLISISIHTWTMTKHDHAADYTRFELIKYASLQKTVVDSSRALPIIARAHVKVAADVYGADVDSAEVTAGMDLGIDDLAVLKTAKKILRNVRRQGMSNAPIDITGDISGFAEAVKAQLMQ